MNLQDMLGGVVQSVTHQPEPTEGQGKQANASGGMLGSVLGTAFSSLGGAQLAEKLNSVTGFLSPETKADLVGSALNKIGVSGDAAKSLLGQLGINPAVADNPEEATPEELARLSQHLQEHEDAPKEENSEEQPAEFSAESSEEIAVQTEEQADDPEPEANAHDGANEHDDER